MPTFFKTSVELPVGTGPTGGCAYCALTREGKRQKAKSKRQKDKTDERSLPLFLLSVRIKLRTLKTFNSSSPLLPFEVCLLPFAFIWPFAFLLLTLLRLLLGPLALQVELYGLVDGDADCARLLVGPAVVLKLAPPLIAHDQVLRLRLRHAFGLGRVVELVLLTVVGLHAEAGRELQARLRRQTLRALSRDRRSLKLLRLLALLEVDEHQKHHDAHDHCEDRQPADEPA